MYSGEMHIIPIKLEKNSFDSGQYSLSHETLQDICDIWEDGWFVRDFQVGDDVDYRYISKVQLRTASNPQYMHLLGHGKHEWGLFFYGSTNGLQVNVINLKTGESKELYCNLVLGTDNLCVYNLTANTKCIGTTTTIRFAFTIFREMYTMDEKLVAVKVDRTNYSGSLDEFFASLDGEWVFDFSVGSVKKNFVPAVNKLKYVLINAMLNYPNHLFESIGDIKFTLLQPSFIERPRIARVKDVDYLIAQDSTGSDSIFQNIVLWRIEENG